MSKEEHDSTGTETGFDIGTRAYALGVGGEFQRVCLSPVVILQKDRHLALVAVQVMSERGEIKRKFVDQSRLRPYPLNGSVEGPLMESAWAKLEEWAANPENRN